MHAAFARDREAMEGLSVFPSALPAGHWFRDVFALAEWIRPGSLAKPEQFDPNQM